MHESGSSPIYCLTTFRERFLAGIRPLGKAISVSISFQKDIFAALRNARNFAVLSSCVLDSCSILLLGVETILDVDRKYVQ